MGCGMDNNINVAFVGFLNLERGKRKGKGGGVPR